MANVLSSKHHGKIMGGNHFSSTVVTILFVLGIHGVARSYHPPTKPFSPFSISPSLYAIPPNVFAGYTSLTPQRIKQHYCIDRNATTTAWRRCRVVRTVGWTLKARGWRRREKKHAPACVRTEAGLCAVAWRQHYRRHGYGSGGPRRASPSFRGGGFHVPP